MPANSHLFTQTRQLMIYVIRKGGGKKTCKHTHWRSSTVNSFYELELSWNYAFEAMQGEQLAEW